jgi:hypothetical protein
MLSYFEAKMGLFHIKEMAVEAKPENYRTSIADIFGIHNGW